MPICWLLFCRCRLCPKINVYNHKLYTMYSWSDITNNRFEPTAFNHLSFFALSSPMLHRCHSEDTWGVQTRKQSVPLTLKIEVVPALHISNSAKRQGHAGAVLQKLSHIDYYITVNLIALAHGWSSYVVAECSHLVPPGIKSHSRQIMTTAAWCFPSLGSIEGAARMCRLGGSGNLRFGL